MDHDVRWNLNEKIEIEDSHPIYHRALSTMDAFIESYGLPTQRFQSLLVENEILFAGSAPLALYLQQQSGSDQLDYLPNDIDLWMSHTKDTYTFLDFFLANGYHLIRSFRQQDHYAHHLPQIERIFTFLHPIRQTQIQLITVRRDNLLDYMVEQFDLSACMTWWNGRENVFETMYPAFTDQKQMFVHQILLSGVGSRRLEERIQKYVQRGFEIVAEPPPSLYEADRRREEDMKTLDITAFDVWEYEEVNGRTHLQESHWNILLQVGENWYAFERMALTNYMEDHRHFHLQHGAWYDTPYRQTLTHDAMTALYYTDFSIYRLIDPTPLEINGVSRSVYTMEAYSVADWIRGIPTHTYEHETGIFLSHPMDDAESSDEEDQNELQQLLSDELHVDLVPPPAAQPDHQANFEEFLNWARSIHPSSM